MRRQYREADDLRGATKGGVVEDDDGLGGMSGTAPPMADADDDDAGDDQDHVEHVVNYIGAVLRRTDLSDSAKLQKCTKLLRTVLDGGADAGDGMGEARRYRRRGRGRTTLEARLRRIGCPTDSQGMAQFIMGASVGGYGELPKRVMESRGAKRAEHRKILSMHGQELANWLMS